MTVRLVVGITGATGTVYGVRLLERLAPTEVHTHLVMTPWGKRTLEHETDYTVAQVQALATSVESHTDLGAVLSSGSYRTAGMVVAPCSVKTLAAIAQGLADNLLTRAADVVLKERRRLVLLVRETPLSEIHLENMLRVTRAGAVVMPPVPAFYNHPQSVEDLVDFTVARALDALDLPAPWARRWDGRVLRRGEGAGDRDGPGDRDGAGDT